MHLVTLHRPKGGVGLSTTMVGLASSTQYPAPVFSKMRTHPLADTPCGRLASWSWGRTASSKRPRRHELTGSRC